MKETKLEKFTRQLREVNISVFRYRVAKRRHGLNEEQRINFRKLQMKQRSLNNAVKSLTK